MMFATLIYTYPILLFFLGIRYPTDKKITILFISYFSILIGLNTYTPDYAEYRRIYYNISNYWNIELGFRLVCLLFNRLGFSYQQFRMFWGIVYSMLAFLTARRYNKNYNYILAMWLIWPCIPFVSGIRFAMAAMIVCYGIPFLLEGQKGLFKYLICICIAALLHFSVMFYFLFIFARKKYSLRDRSLVISAIIILVILIRMNIISYAVSGILPRMMAYKVQKWLTVTSSLNSDRFLAESFVVIIFFILLNKMIKVSIRTYGSTMNYYIKRSILCENIGFLMLFLIPAYTVSPEFHRLFYGILLMYYSVFADFKYSKLLIKPTNKNGYIMLADLAVLLVIVLAYLTTGTFNFGAVLKDNIITQGINVFFE